MGQATSTPVSRGANGPSSRRISRYLRRGDGPGDDDGGPHTQEELEAPTPGPHNCAAAGDHHLDDHPHLPQGHRLVRAHHPQPEQAPSTAETSEKAGGNRSSKKDRMGSPAMAQSPETAANTAAATSKAPGTAGEEEAAPSALAQVQASTSTSTSATPAPLNREYTILRDLRLLTRLLLPAIICSAQSMEQSRECILDPPPASRSSPTSPSAPITTATQPLEQPGERVLNSTSTTGPSTTTATSSVAPVTTMESLQSALASSHAATPPDSVTPPISPPISSSALPSISPQQPLAPSSSPPTIEVSRIPVRNTTTTPATRNHDPNSAVEETRPLLDKGKKKEAGETNDREISEPLASGSSPRSTSTPISNIPHPVSESNSPDTLLNGTSSHTTPSTSSNTINTSDTTPTPNNTPISSNTTPATTPSPRTTTSRASTSPSSTDVLGLLLSIAAQATAEALVPWSVPPRSRTTSREGIASGLAAAFSALAGAGAGLPAGADSSTGSAVSEPVSDPQPIIQPLAPPQPASPEPQPSSRRVSGLSSRRFSRLSMSPGRISSLSSRRLSSLIPGRGEESSRRLSTPIPRRPTSPTQRRASSEHVSQPRRGVLGRLERLVPRRLRRDSDVASFRRTSLPNQLPLDESVDFGRAPPTSTLPVSALPESSVSPLPSPPLPHEPSTISVPAPSISSPASSPVSRIPVPPPSSDIPVPPSSFLPTSPASPSTLSATPATDAEELIRFSQMLGFTPGAVHPSGTFERFLSDMQDELRVVLGEYQDRARSRVVDGRAVGTERSGNALAAEGNLVGGEEGNLASVEGDGEGSRTTTLLDHTRPHVPSTDPLPLNWWRMYRFPELPDGTTPSAGSGSGATSARTPPASNETSATSSPVTSATTSPTETPASTDTEPPQPIHPAIIIGLRSISRDPTEEAVPSNPSEPESGDRARSREGGDRIRRFESGDRVRSRPRRLRLGEEEERRARDGTRNYIIWIIGGYYPSNHPLLAHPNLFLGQVHPDELWMLNEFLGQVKPPTATREDIANAGLRVVKGVDIKALAQSGAVTENCTERCLICLDDYNDDDDLRIMNCKHMFHRDCVDRWMETGRNSCPACRTKGVETTPTSESSSTFAS
ncbi:hypothetical protein OPQ81_011704 [Rhizoctonia solani]|nr:hypothetical protein OPQ81_011704 [Rhizoctonia solani]